MVLVRKAVHTSVVAQDVYRRLSASAALGGLLRVRLSPELRVARAYGPLAADERCPVPILLATLSLCIAGLVPGSPPYTAASGPGCQGLTCASLSVLIC